MVSVNCGTETVEAFSFFLSISLADLSLSPPMTLPIKGCKVKGAVSHVFFCSIVFSIPYSFSPMIFFFAFLLALHVVGQ